jgi:hypothetical protein
MLSGETRRAPAPPDSSSYQLERSRPQGDLSGMQYSHRKLWARSVSPQDTLTHTQGKKKKTE